MAAQYIIEIRQSKVAHAVVSGTHYVVRYPDGTCIPNRAYGLHCEALNHIERHAKKNGHDNFVVETVEVRA